MSRWHAAWIESPCMTQARVLVADDQADILQALRLLLSEAGFDTDLVSSVEAASWTGSARAATTCCSWI